MPDFSAAIAEFTVIVFAGLLVAAAVSDWRSLTIPNRYSVAIVALFPSYVLAMDGAVDWQLHLAFAAGAFAFGFVLFSLRWFGGGDVKLFAAATLWAGPQLFIPLFYYTAMCGGAMALLIWLHHRYQRAGILANFLVVRSEEGFAKKPIPYAVAIAASGLYVALRLLSKA